MKKFSYNRAKKAQDNLLQTKSFDERDYARKFNEERKVKINTDFKDITSFLDKDTGWFVLDEFKNSAYETEIIIGGRNIGKTRSILNEMLYSYMKEGAKFAILVDTNDAVNGQRSRFDKALNEENIPITMKSTMIMGGLMAFYDMEHKDEPMGYVVSIGAADKLKEVDFFLVKTIWCDEFMTKDIRLRDFFTLVETIKRQSKVNVYLTGNIEEYSSPFSELTDLETSHVDEEHSIRVTHLATSPIVAKETMPMAKGTLYEQQARMNRQDFVEIYKYLTEFYIEALMHFLYAKDYEEYEAMLARADEGKIMYDEKTLSKTKAHELYLKAYAKKAEIEAKIKEVNIISKLIFAPANKYIIIITDKAEVIRFSVIKPKNIYNILHIEPQEELDAIIKRIPKVIVDDFMLKTPSDFENIINLSKNNKTSKYIFLLESNKYFANFELEGKKSFVKRVHGNTPVHEFVRKAKDNKRVSFATNSSYEKLKGMYF